MKEQIERIAGAPVLELEFVQGRGYTHAGRHRAFLEDGRTVFVKSAVDELSAGWLRVEIAVYTQLRGSFMPSFTVGRSGKAAAHRARGSRQRALAAAMA